VAFKTLFNGLALNITTAIFNNWIDDCSDAQEAKHIKDAKNKVITANASDQNNETTNESFMGIVANAT